MNRRNIKFEKVSREQFKKDMMDVLNNSHQCHVMSEKDIDNIYDNIKLPERKTKFSAGYDFFLPFSVVLHHGDSIVIPTGIRCSMDEDLVLEIYPRSSYGFKYKMRLANTTGIIDSDYYNSENEGHILIKITTDIDCTDIVAGGISNKKTTFEAGNAFSQGLFKQFFISNDDEVDTVRTGGIGSTGK